VCTSSCSYRTSSQTLGKCEARQKPWPSFRNCVKHIKAITVGHSCGSKKKVERLPVSRNAEDSSDILQANHSESLRKLAPRSEHEPAAVRRRSWPTASCPSASHGHIYQPPRGTRASVTVNGRSSLQIVQSGDRRGADGSWGRGGIPFNARTPLVLQTHFFAQNCRD